MPLAAPARCAPLPLMLAALCGGLIGCAGTSPLPSAASLPAEPYAGPPLSLDPERQAVVLSAPSPGWRITLDYVLERHDTYQVFATVRRPEPTFIYPDRPVTQVAAIGIPPATAVALYARVAEARGRLDNADFRPVTLPPTP